MLAELDTQRVHIQEFMLRISGAIQVLEEELAKKDKPVDDVDIQPESEEIETA